MSKNCSIKGKEREEFAMSGGEMRKHTRCKKSKKWDGSSSICKVCGYRVFYEDNQTLDSFGENQKLINKWNGTADSSSHNSEEKKQ